VVTEHYLIGNLWKTNSIEKHLEAEFYGDSLYRRLSNPDVLIAKDCRSELNISDEAGT